MKLTSGIAVNLKDAIHLHFTNGLKALTMNEQFTKKLGVLLNEEISTAFSKEYIPTEADYVANYTDLIDVQLMLKKQGGYTTRTSPVRYQLNKEYPLLNTVISIAETNKPTVIERDAYFTKGTKAHSARMYLIEINTTNGIFKEFIERRKSFNDAEATLIKVVDQEYNKGSSVERLVLRLPAIKAFLIRQGVEV